MNDDSGEQPGTPERVVTPNMLAAYNMERFRTVAAMTQEELGRELGGWTKKAVSAAERTWDGAEGRMRKFDADLIADLATIFRVPVTAFFLPPPDDGEGTRYVVKTAGELATMGEFFALLWPEPNWEADSRAASAYQQAVISTMAKYGSGEAAEALAGAMGDLVAAEEIEDALRGARANREALAGLHSLIGKLEGDNAVLQEALERALARKKESP